MGGRHATALIFLRFFVLGHAAQHQRWYISDGFIKYKSSPTHCASVRQGEIIDGSDIILWNCRDSREFRWVVEDKFIKLKENPKYCLSVREGKGGDGSDIILWT